PFSERVPYRDYFPFKQIRALLYDLIWGIGDYTPGDEYTLFHFTRPGGVCRFAVPICYESAFPAVVRTFCRDGADFLVVITNDAWFGRTSGPYQHARIAVFRAIENRIGIARCANTGISCFIDPCGRVSKTTALDQQVVLTGNVVLRHRTTWYTRHGDLFAWLCVLISATLLIVSVISKKNN
ncbi:apolipoprotein N-acyltransferase, partial [bacterium]|nr:apolipoprotein N-acyltransferase [bacterium]